MLCNTKQRKKSAELVFSKFLQSHLQAAANNFNIAAKHGAKLGEAPNQYGIAFRDST